MNGYLLRTQCRKSLDQNFSVSKQEHADVCVGRCLHVKLPTRPEVFSFFFSFCLANQWSREGPPGRWFYLYYYYSHALLILAPDNQALVVSRQADQIDVASVVDETLRFVFAGSDPEDATNLGAARLPNSRIGRWVLAEA
jgi:hypothetical protein